MNVGFLFLVKTSGFSGVEGWSDYIQFFTPVTTVVLEVNEQWRK
ncbi:hypothetical protein P799_05350 [Lysinibacillus sphaericus CBAM5]|uniref:Uncharacterized protein n=2 Tax=Lysinibacillus sphaericus TaxID=1421 RepID=B1HTC1_LYSSC|nr:hypothetical protein Bsph_1948 [Lysinibacillus sphaericus C3-41]EWH34176.1 hypothetical protein P799_05350 [Lysinibacillus sphaericus CBAM5]